MTNGEAKRIEPFFALQSLKLRKAFLLTSRQRKFGYLVSQ